MDHSEVTTPDHDLSMKEQASTLICTDDICIAPNLVSKNSKKKGETIKDKSTNSSSFIQNIYSQHELDALLQKQSDGIGPEIIIVEFVTTWCGACKSIQPLFEKLASQQEPDQLMATQVVCDKNKQTKKYATSVNINSYPVFWVFRNGKEMTRWNGADVGKLEKVFSQTMTSGKRKGGKKKKKR